VRRHSACKGNILYTMVHCVYVSIVVCFEQQPTLAHSLEHCFITWLAETPLRPLEPCPRRSQVVYACRSALSSPIGLRCRTIHDDGDHQRKGHMSMVLKMLSTFIMAYRVMKLREFLHASITIRLFRASFFLHEYKCRVVTAPECSTSQNFESVVSLVLC
jgi:hypothetical protein